MAGYGRIFFTAGAASNYRNLLSCRSNVSNSKMYATLSPKDLEKLGIPPKPKRPASTYIKFLEMERQKALKSGDSSLSGRAHIQNASKKWATYDPKEKEALRKQYDLDMLAYSKQVMIYEQSLTPAQKQAMADALTKLQAKSERLYLKKKCDELGRPKKPPTGFLQFLHENKVKKDKDGSTMDWVRSCAEQWRRMTEEEKSKYTIESQKLMEQYKQDLREWEEKMVRKGHIDVVRNRGLIDIKSGNPGNAE